MYIDSIDKIKVVEQLIITKSRDPDLVEEYEEKKVKTVQGLHNIYFTTQF